MSMWFRRGGCQMSMFVYKGGGRGQKWAKICLRGLWRPPIGGTFDKKGIYYLTAAQPVK